MMTERRHTSFLNTRCTYLLVAILFTSAILNIMSYELFFSTVTHVSLYKEDIEITEPPPAPIIPPTAENPVNKLRRELPNVPLAYWQSVRAHSRRTGRPSPHACGRLPWLENIDFHNTFWQTLTAPNASYNFLNAYYDDRVLNEGSTVRIIAMINNPDPPKVFCQFWFDGVITPLIVESEEHYMMWDWDMPGAGVFHPFLITCRLPTNTSGVVPRAVAVAASRCDAVNNLLRVVYDLPPADVGRRKFAVCVKGLDFPDGNVALRLSEWLELVTALGADRVLMYKLQVHADVDRVLDHYAAKGIVQVVPSTLAGGSPNYPLLQHIFLMKDWFSNVFNEVVQLNDCFYRNLHTYEYVVILDTDEVIMPLCELRSWAALLAAVGADNSTVASYNARNVYFFDTHMTGRPLQSGIPQYMHILHHVIRARHFRARREASKSFFSTQRVLAVHNHYPLRCFDDWCDNQHINKHLAEMAHYKDNCATTHLSAEICEDFDENVFNDTSAWRFKDELIAGVQEMLHATGLTYTS